MPAAAWNPHTPEVVGLEYAPNVVGQAAVATTPAPTAVFTASADEAIYAVRAYLATLVAVPAAIPVVVDIYDATDPAAPPWAVTPGTSLLSATASPNTDFQFIPSGAFVAENGATTGFYSHVDESELTLDVSNYFDYAQVGTANAFCFFRATSGFKDPADGVTSVDISAKRIAEVRVRAWATNFSTHAMALGGVLSIPFGSQYQTYYTPRQNLLAGSGLQRVTFRWETNPMTGFPWTHVDVADFLTGGHSAWGVWITGSLPSGATVRIYAVQFEVVYADETRVATGAASLGSTSGATYGWRQFLLRNPTSNAEAAWAKKAGNRYWVVISQPGGSRPVAWYFVDGDTLGGWGTQQTPLQATGTNVPDPTAQWPPTVDTRAPALALVNGASFNSLSPDSQPYATVGTVEVAVGGAVVQTLTPPAAVPYGLAFVWARAPSGAIPTAPLDVTIVDTSAGGAIVAGPSSIAPFLTDDTGTFQRYLVAFDTTFTPTAGHVYGVRLTSATLATAPWHVALLDSLDTPLPGNASAADAGYGGTALGLSIGGTLNGQRDSPLAIAQLPPPIVGVAADLYAQPLGAASPTPGACAVTTTGAAVISWTPTTLSQGVFAYVEIQRSDGSDGYQTIATLTDPAAAAFYDFEARRNTVASYRVRQVRRDGAHSDWSAVVAVTILAAETDFLLVSNVLPDLNVGYIHEPGGQSYDFLDSDRVVLRALFGRDGQVAYRPLEGRGDHFKRTCTIAFNDPSVPVGRAAFESVRAITRAYLPYVAVLDGDGTRWYASVKVTNAVRDEPGGRYHADVDVTTSATVAAPVRTAWSPIVPPGGGTTPGTLYGDAGGTYGDGTYGN